MPAHSRTRKAPPPEEVELLAASRAYEDNEKQKSVKWFTALGTPIPTEEQIESLQQEKAAETEEKNRKRREEDRQRKHVEVGHVATVACAVHPLYATEEEGGWKEPKFGVVAATGLDGRQVLQQRFANCCFAGLLRNRVEQRLTKMMQARATNSVKSGQRQSTVNFLEGVNLTLLQFPNCLPPNAAATVDGQPEEPSDTNVEQFKEKELRTPFEYKQKDLSQIKFSEHHFANADLPEVVPPLPAGHAEVPELDTPNAAVASGAVEHFVQPTVTLETFPAAQFVFARIDPSANLLSGPEAQPITDGGFLLPHDGVQHKQAVPSGNVASDFISSTILRRPAPAVMKRKVGDDELSDTDDDEGTELPQTHPSSLSQVAGWLPLFKQDGGAPPTTSPAKDSKTTADAEGADGAEGGADGKEPAAADPYTLWSTWEPKYAHRMPDPTTNELLLNRQRELHTWTDGVLGTVPAPQRKVL